MKESIEKVKEWYNDERSYEYMEESLKKGLKIWEKYVADTFFSEAADILNIGCGTGREAFALYNMGRGFKITGADISDPILAEAKNIADKYEIPIKFIKTNGLDLPFSDSGFDVVIIWAQTFGLLYGQENKTALLNECKRVLKKGGILSFSAHEKEYTEKYCRQYVDGGKFYAYKECYWKTFTADELRFISENAGFEVLDCRRGEIYMPEDVIIIHCVCKY